MFLVGGAAYSGTTLLALLLNQEGVTCLNEPDFHDPEQSHNGLPMLARLYPDRTFPRRTNQSLTLRQALDLMQTCQEVIQPDRLGVKFCNRVFLGFVRLFREAGFPVVAIIRDVRDSLARPLQLHDGGENGLIQRYRTVWQNRELYDAVVRYEDLTAHPSIVISKVSRTIGCPLTVRAEWHPDDVPGSMMHPRYRHYLLKAGGISRDRVGIWKDSGKRISAAAHELAREMGY